MIINFYKRLSFDQVEKILNMLDKEYVPYLSEQVIIKKYAEKLSKGANFITLEDDIIVGIIAFYLNSEYCYISSFGLISAYQGKGMAKRMFHKLLKRVRQQKISEIILEVNRNNTKAILFYTNIGFKKEKENYSSYVYKMELT